MNFSIRTYGCKVNQYESQVIREDMVRRGYAETREDDADVIIFNTCTVTESADREAFREIRKARRQNPSAEIVVTGCLASLEKDVAVFSAMSEVSKIIPQGKKISGSISGFESHARAFVKAQDGCDQSCSYCKVRFVRGPSRSREKKEILEEARRLLDAGYRELVLTGICLGSWKDAGGETLADVVRAMNRLEGKFRVRLSSIEPNYFDDGLISSIAESEKICRHLHIPLQSGSDRILAVMKRRYGSSGYRLLIKRLRKKMPLLGITTDIMAGFPGESEEDHEKTASFVAEIAPSRLHVFGYSDRGTIVRSSFPRGEISLSEKRERVSELIAMGKKLERDFSDKFLAKRVVLLVESEKKDGISHGYTGEYVRVRLPGFAGSIGELVEAIPFREGTSSCLTADGSKVKILKASAV